MRRAHIFSVVTILGLLASSSAHAFDWFGGRLSIGGGYGLAKPKLPYSYQETFEEGPMWTAHMKYFLNDNFSLVASYANLEPHLRGDNDDKYRFRPIVASMRFNIFHNLPFSPYLTAGAGYSINKHEAPGAETSRWEDFTYQGGVGLEFFITEGTSLGAEALYHHFEADAANHPYRLISGVGTVNIYFGAGPSKKRAEEALEREKQAAQAAREEAERQRNQAAAAQQEMTAAQQATIAAQAQAQQAQAQVAQAQADVEKIKQMVASKEISAVTFKTGSAELEATSSETLNKVSEITKRYPNLKLRIEGHTDSVGEAAFNQDLSQRRADAVKKYIVETGGVPESQVTAVGFGESRPIAGNDTATGRSQNRRVEFMFTL